MPNLSARAHRHGGLGGALALSYLGLVALLLVPAAAEAVAPGPADGSFFFGFGMQATRPGRRLAGLGHRSGRRIRPMVEAPPAPPLA